MHQTIEEIATKTEECIKKVVGRQYPVQQRKDQE